MLSGTLSSHALHTVFRTLSRKKRHGVLEITSGDSLLRALFHNGRIVEALQVDDSESQRICDRLERAGRLPQGVRESLEDVDLDVNQLYDFLVEKKYVTHEDFVLAKTGIEYDLLYSLRDIDEGFFNFKPKMVKFDPRFSISITPGQLMLDLVELNSEEESFQAVFGDAESMWRIVLQDDEMPNNLSDPENMIVSAAEVSSSLQEITSLTMLNEYILREGLLALYNRNVLLVETAAVVELDEGVEEEREEAADFSPTFDDALFPSDVADAEEFEHESEDDEDFLFESLAPTVSDAAVNGSDSTPEEADAEVKSMIDDAADMLRSLDGDLAKSESALEDDLIAELNDALGELDDASDYTARASNLSDEDDLDSTDVSSDAEKSEQFDVSQSFFGRINSAISERDVEKNFVLGVMCVFVTALAIAGPIIIDRWFNMLSEFSSLP